MIHSLEYRVTLTLVFRPLGEDKMTPPLLPFPVFREVFYTDDSSTKMLSR